MLGYRIPGNPIEMGMKDRYITEWLLEESFAVSAQYVPDMPVKLSSSCCSGASGFPSCVARPGAGGVIDALSNGTLLTLGPRSRFGVWSPPRRLPLLLGGWLSRDRLF